MADADPPAGGLQGHPGAPAAAAAGAAAPGRTAGRGAAARAQPPPVRLPAAAWQAAAGALEQQDRLALAAASRELRTVVLGTPALWGHVYMTLDLKEPEGVQREVDRAVSFCSWLRRHASDVHKLQFIITQRAGFDLQTAQLLELFSIACSSVLACAATLHTLTVIFPGPLTLSSCWLPASLKVLMVTGSTVKLAASCRELQLRELCIESGTPLDDESMAAMPPTLPFLYLEGAAVSVLPPSLAQATCLQVLQLHRGSPSNTEVLARLGHLRELSLEELPQSTLPGLLESISQLTGLQALFIPRCSTPSSLDDLHLLLDDALARLPHLKILSLGAPFFCEEAPPSLVQLSHLSALYFTRTGLERLPPTGRFLAHLRLIALDAAALPGCVDALVHAPRLHTLFVDTSTYGHLEMEDATRVLAALAKIATLRRVVFVSNPTVHRCGVCVGLLHLVLHLSRWCPRATVSAVHESEFFAINLVHLTSDPDSWAAPPPPQDMCV